MTTFHFVSPWPRVANINHCTKVVSTKNGYVIGGTTVTAFDHVNVEPTSDFDSHVMAQISCVAQHFCVCNKGLFQKMIISNATHHMNQATMQNKR